MSGQPMPPASAAITLLDVLPRLSPVSHIFLFTLNKSKNFARLVCKELRTFIDDNVRELRLVVTFENRLLWATRKRWFERFPSCSSIQLHLHTKNPYDGDALSGLATLPFAALDIAARSRIKRLAISIQVPAFSQPADQSLAFCGAPVSLVATCLPNLRTLDLSQIAVVTLSRPQQQQQMMDALATLPYLSALILPNGAPLDHIGTLASSTSLKDLQVAQNSIFWPRNDDVVISQQAIEGISRLQHLKHLDLSGCHFFLEKDERAACPAVMHAIGFEAPLGEMPIGGGLMLGGLGPLGGHNAIAAAAAAAAARAEAPEKPTHTALLRSLLQRLPNSLQTLHLVVGCLTKTSRVQLVCILHGGCCHRLQVAPSSRVVGFAERLARALPPGFISHEQSHLILRDLNVPHIVTGSLTPLTRLFARVEVQNLQVKNARQAGVAVGELRVMPDCLQMYSLPEITLRPHGRTTPPCDKGSKSLSGRSCGQGALALRSLGPTSLASWLPAPGVIAQRAVQRLVRSASAVVATKQTVVAVLAPARVERTTRRQHLRQGMGVGDGSDRSQLTGNSGSGSLSDAACGGPPLLAMMERESGPYRLLLTGSVLSDLARGSNLSGVCEWMDAMISRIHSDSSLRPSPLAADTIRYRVLPTGTGAVLLFCRSQSTMLALMSAVGALAVSNPHYVVQMIPLVRDPGSGLSPSFEGSLQEELQALWDMRPPAAAADGVAGGGGEGGTYVDADHELLEELLEAAEVVMRCVREEAWPAERMQCGCVGSQDSTLSSPVAPEDT